MKKTKDAMEEFRLAILKRDRTTIKRLAQNGTGTDWATVVYALEQMRPDMVSLLIETGADVNAENYYGIPPLTYATKENDLQSVTLLLKHGANPNPPDPCIAPLYWAACRGNVEIVRRLLNSGADASHRESNAMTALLAASKLDYVEITKLLVDAGADPYYVGPAGLNAFKLANRELKQYISQVRPPSRSGDEKHTKPMSLVLPRRPKPNFRQGEAGDFREFIYTCNPEWGIWAIEAPIEAVTKVLATLANGQVVATDVTKGKSKRRRIHKVTPDIADNHYVMPVVRI